jgi:hypothetical protein
MSQAEYVSIQCKFVFKCPKVWLLLGPTAEATRRHCPACDRDVFLVRTEAELRDHTAAGHCVAVPVDEPPITDVGEREPPTTVGRVGVPYGATGETTTS